MPEKNAAKPCRERTEFPWQGMLLAEVALAGEASFKPGKLVTVTGKDKDKEEFAVEVRAGETTARGTVRPDQVDEVLGAVIERDLLDRERITWDNSPSWKAAAYIAAKGFELAESESESDQRAKIAPGTRVWARPLPSRPGYYEVSHGTAYGEVTADTLVPAPDILSPTAKLELLCFELGPYAAALAGLCPRFVDLALTPNTTDGTRYWAQALGATMRDGTFKPGEVPSVRVERGDLVLFYNLNDTGIHTAIATGDAQMVYSLWNRPADNRHPLRASIKDLCDSEDDLWKVTHVRIAVPPWHASPKKT